ncbi:MAG: hypothetical protein LBH97_02560 [Treponema sp.]|jgi:hypothetical protein|nr:hypothetical protein [Treponema sp.]
MKYPILIIFICLSLSVLYAIPPDELERSIKLGAVEGLNKDFRNVDGSENYIRTFSLNDDEIKMLGSWGFDGIVCKTPKDRKYGPGIGIKFFLNRYFRIQKEDQNNGQIKWTYGKWKVENKMLLVKFEARLVIIDWQSKSISEKCKIEYYEDENYYPIFEIPEYEKAYYNTEAFKWDILPPRMRSFYGILLEDAPRSRLLFDTLGDPPGDIRPDSKYGRVLLNPQKSDEYYLALTEVWSSFRW